MCSATVTSQSGRLSRPSTRRAVSWIGRCVLDDLIEAIERPLQLVHPLLDPIALGVQHRALVCIGVSGVHTGQQRGDVAATQAGGVHLLEEAQDRKSTRLNSSHVAISYAVFCLKNKNWATPHEARDENA